MIVTAEKLVSGGDCIARIDGKAVFFPFALPGEVAEIEITQDKKDYAFARTLSILEKSPHRVDPTCPYFGLCGGCSLQMADSAYQGELRLSILTDAFSRAHATVDSPFQMLWAEPLGYRSRFQFHRSPKGPIGLKEGSSSSIIPVESCPVAVKEIRQALAQGELQKISDASPWQNRFHVFAHGGRIGTSLSDTLFSIQLLDRPIQFDVRGFFQSNIPLLEQILSTLKNLDSGPPLGRPQGRLLDMYAGVGTLSAFAGMGFEETVLVEHNRHALDFARKNLSHLGQRPTLCAVDDEAWPSHRASRLTYDVAIVDPPRQGIGKQAMEWFCAKGIPEIRYVSCDPVTLARDAARLIAGGYRVESVTMFDFYPQTAHLESLAVFRRNA